MRVTRAASCTNDFVDPFFLLLLAQTQIPEYLYYLLPGFQPPDFLLLLDGKHLLGVRPRHQPALRAFVAPRNLDAGSGAVASVFENANAAQRYRAGALPQHQRQQVGRAAALRNDAPILPSWLGVCGRFYCFHGGVL